MLDQSYYTAFYENVKVTCARTASVLGYTCRGQVLLVSWDQGLTPRWFRRVPWRFSAKMLRANKLWVYLVRAWENSLYRFPSTAPKYTEIVPETQDYYHILNIQWNFHLRFLWRSVDLNTKRRKILTGNNHQGYSFGITEAQC